MNDDKTTGIYFLSWMNYLCTSYIEGAEDMIYTLKRKHIESWRVLDPSKLLPPCTYTATNALYMFICACLHHTNLRSLELIKKKRINTTCLTLATKTRASTRAARPVTLVKQIKRWHLKVYKRHVISKGPMVKCMQAKRCQHLQNTARLTVFKCT